MRVLLIESSGGLDAEATDLIGSMQKLADADVAIVCAIKDGHIVVSDHPMKCRDGEFNVEVVQLRRIESA